MARGPVVASIAGGFVRVEVAALLHAWKACLGRPGGAGDFRAWLAAHEMRARRVRIATKGVRTASFGVAELASLCGVGMRRAGAAVRRLVRSGLLTWAEDGEQIEFPLMADDAPTEVGGAVDASLPGRSGILAIPRRILRLLAHGARPALIATALAALLRCLSRRKAGWGSRGRIKASWVAEVFGVDARRVKAARAELVAMRWLEPEGDSGDQWSWNRWGRAYRVDLGWATTVVNRHPSDRRSSPESPPPDLHPDPVPEGSNPDPGHAGRAGIRLCRDGENGPPAPSLASPVPSRDDALVDRSPGPGIPALPRPTLRDIRAQDLQDTERTLDLHRQAIKAGWLSESEADRLRFVAAAVHARVVGTTNPAGLFRAIVEGRRWSVLTQGDEDRARGRLRAHDTARIGPPWVGPADRATPPGLPTALVDILARFRFAPPS